MDCHEARELLQDELDARLPAADVARLAEHVAGCAACAAERRDLHALRAAFRAVPRVPAPAGFRDGVVAALPRGRLRRLPWALGAVAAVAAGALFAVLLGPGREAEPPAGETTTAAAARNELADSPRAAPAAELKKQAEGAVAVDEAEAPTAPSTPGAPPALDRAVSARKSEEPKKPEAAEEAKPGFAPVPAERAAGAKTGELPKGAIPDDSRVPADPAPSSGRTPPSVRYVVFRDAAAAAEYVRSLTPDATKSRGAGKVGAAQDGALAGAPPPAPAPSAPVAKDDEKRRDGDEPGARPAARAEASKAPAPAGDRVVGRAALPAGMTDAQFRAAVQKAGGSFVTAGDVFTRARRADAVPGAGGPRLPVGGKIAAGGGTGGAEDKSKSPAKEKGPKDDAESPPDGGSAAAADSVDALTETATGVTVVVVVLEDPKRPK